MDAKSSQPVIKAIRWRAAPSAAVCHLLCSGGKEPVYRQQPGEKPATFQWLSEGLPATVCG